MSKFPIVEPTDELNSETYGGEKWFRLASTVLQEDFVVIQADFLRDCASGFPRNRFHFEMSPYIDFYEKSRSTIDSLSMRALVAHLKSVPKSNRPGIIVYNGAVGVGGKTMAGHYECYQRQRAPCEAVCEIWTEMLKLDLDPKIGGHELRGRGSANKAITRQATQLNLARGMK